MYDQRNQSNFTFLKRYTNNNNESNNIIKFNKLENNETPGPDRSLTITGRSTDSEHPRCISFHGYFKI